MWTTSAIFSAPWHRVLAPAVLVALSGLGGFGYEVIVTARARRQTDYRPVLEDWVWHSVLPLVAYATLYPLSGWREPGGSAFAFLGAPWPRYVTAFDLATNFFGYLPFGLLCVLAVNWRHSRAAAVALATVAGAVLSLLLESAQSFLPARIASNVDVLANVAGAAAGALTAVVFEFIRHQLELTVRVDLLQPGLAQFAWNGLLWVIGQHHNQAIDLTAGLIDQILVAAVGRVELADHEAEAHARASGLACALAHTARHRINPIAAITVKTAYRIAVKARPRDT